MEKQIIWKAVPEYPGYEVSERGDLRHDGKDLKPEATFGNGRKRFSLWRNGYSTRLKATQIVALAFIGPKPFPLAEVCHNDGFEHNNHYSNLRYDSHQGNAADAVEHKLQKRIRAGLRVKKHELIAAQTSRFLAEAKKSGRSSAA